MPKTPKISTTADNADRHAAAAAEVTLRRLAFQIGPKDSSAASLSEALIPVYGLPWNRMILARCDANRLNEIPAMIRNSPLPRTEYDRLSAFWMGAYISAASSPTGMVCRGNLAGRFRLERACGWDSLLGGCIFLVGKGVVPQSELPHSPHALLSQVLSEATGPKPLRACGRLLNLMPHRGVNQANT